MLGFYRGFISISKYVVSLLWSKIFLESSVKVTEEIVAFDPKILVLGWCPEQNYFRQEKNTTG